MRPLIAALVLLCATGSQAEIVYSNMRNSGIIWQFLLIDGTPQVGDRIQLAGSARTLQSVEWQFAHVNLQQPHLGTFDFFTSVCAIDPTTGLPGAVLSSHTLTNVSYNTREFTVSVPMPAIELADEIFVTAHLFNASQTEYGVLARNPPETGTSDPHRWYQVPPSTGQWEEVVVEQNWGNLGVRVNAVPEPSILLAMGSFAIAFLIRRRAQSSA